MGRVTHRDIEAKAHNPRYLRRRPATAREMNVRLFYLVRHGMIEAAGRELKLHWWDCRRGRA